MSFVLRKRIKEHIRNRAHTPYCVRTGLTRGVFVEFETVRGGVIVTISNVIHRHYL